MDHPPSKNNFEMSVVQKVREEKSDKFPQASQKKKKKLPRKKSFPEKKLPRTNTHREIIREATEI